MTANDTVNILFTSAGRRTYLLNYFRDALDRLKILGLVVGADHNPNAVALSVADISLKAPPIASDEYEAWLISTCLIHNIKLLIPLNDFELLKVSRVSSSLKKNGTIAVVATEDIVDICLDKKKSANYISNLGMQSPITFTSLIEVHTALQEGTVSFPMIVKPRWGSGSIGIERVDNLKDLNITFILVGNKAENLPTKSSDGTNQDNVIVQEALRGHEFGLDVVNDLHGKYVATFVKRKLAMRGGETDRARVVHSDELQALGRCLGESLSHLGNVDCDVFLTTNGPVVLELNPRFGGGYPFSHIAGANVPAALLLWAVGREPSIEFFQPHVGFVAAKTDVLIPLDI